MVRHSRLLAAGLVLVLLFAGACKSASGAEEDREYALKAAYLLNFLKFTEWPADTEPADESCVMAVLGHDPFGFALDSTMAGKTVRNKAIEIRRFPDLKTLAESKQTVHVVFVSSSVTNDIESVIAVVGSTNVLLVGDSPDFCDKGGTIGFVTIENRLKFNVNLDSARKMNLKISSQLLKLANVVKDSKSEEAGSETSP